MSKNLQHETMYGLFWSFFERIGQQGIQFLITVILARLLLPEQFGLIAMLTIFIAVAQSFVDSGFGSALIQKQDASAHVDISPFNRWTDGKIRCHLLCCVIALVALRLIKATVNENRAGEAISGPTIIDQMRQPHSALLLYPGKREARRVLEWRCPH